MKPRVLFVSHSSALGGAELSMLDIVSCDGFESAVFLFEDGDLVPKLRDRSVPTTIVPVGAKLSAVRKGGGLLTDVSSVPALVSIARSLASHGRTFDLLYANTQKSMIAAAIAGMLNRRPVLWHLRDILNQEHFSAGHLRIVRGIVNTFVTRVVANSEATRDAYVRNGGRLDKVSTVYNAIDAQPFLDAQPEDAASLRRELRAEDAFVMAIFGRLSKWKGQDVFLRALSQIESAHGWIVGSAMFESDRAHEQQLKTLSKALGVADRVRFLGFRSDIPALMSTADVIVHASTAPEPFGRVLVEGMLAGRPVIAADDGGAREIVEDGVTGWLVPPSDVEALVQKIREIRTSPHLGAVTDRARQSAISRFSLERLEVELTEIVESVVRS